MLKTMDNDLGFGHFGIPSRRGNIVAEIKSAGQ